MTMAWISILVILMAVPAALPQSLSVSPVNVSLAAGVKNATLMIVNHAEEETSVQIRIFTWSQKDDGDQLSETPMVVVSPPIASIAPGGSQVVRILLRQPPQNREATYRILVDQIPNAAKAGGVRMVLRMSIPVFVLPAARAVSHLQFHLERDGDKVFLVCLNDGLRHDLLRDIALTAADGRKFKIAPGTPPYILSGVTHRWPIQVDGTLPKPGEVLHLTSSTDFGSIGQDVQLVTAR
jgi:fimbrial chaperone protein